MTDATSTTHQDALAQLGGQDLFIGNLNLRSYLTGARHSVNLELIALPHGSARLHVTRPSSNDPARTERRVVSLPAETSAALMDAHTCEYTEDEQLIP